MCRQLLTHPTSSNGFSKVAQSNFASAHFQNDSSGTVKKGKDRPPFLLTGGVLKSLSGATGRLGMGWLGWAGGRLVAALIPGGVPLRGPGADWSPDESVAEGSDGGHPELDSCRRGPSGWQPSHSAPSVAHFQLHPASCFSPNLPSHFLLLSPPHGKSLREPEKQAIFMSLLCWRGWQHTPDQQSYEHSVNTAAHGGLRQNPLIYITVDSIVLDIYQLFIVGVQPRSACLKKHPYCSNSLR